MLAEGEAVALELGNSAEPLPALVRELCGGQVCILRTQPVDGDPERVERGIVDIGVAQPADDVKSVHAADCQDLGVAMAATPARKESVRDRAKRPNVRAISGL
jgi:hypothetical protein